MQHKETVIVPASTRTKVVKVTCDLCQGEIKNKRFDLNEVTVSHKTGESYPEGGMGELAEVDMCGTCFTEKLVPWLEAQGVTPTTEDWSW